MLMLEGNSAAPSGGRGGGGGSSGGGGSAMVDGSLRFYCQTCPYLQRVEETITKRIPLVRKKVDDILGGDKAWENVDQTDAACPHCESKVRSAACARAPPLILCGRPRHALPPPCSSSAAARVLLADSDPLSRRADDHILQVCAMPGKLECLGVKKHLCSNPTGSGRVSVARGITMKAGAGSLS